MENRYVGFGTNNLYVFEVGEGDGTWKSVDAFVAHLLEERKEAVPPAILPWEVIMDPNGPQYLLVPEARPAH